MVFSSLTFLFCFLPIVLGGYYLCHWLLPTRAKHLWLTLLSYVFYGWTNPLFVLLMFLSTLVDYLCGLAMTGGLRRRAPDEELPLLERGGSRTAGQGLALLVSICGNLALLGFFKYYNFGLDTWNATMAAAGLEAYVYRDFLRIALPLGISFYTFQSMSYSIDIYRGDGRAIRNWMDFACYVSMFPQLVAGPIIRFQEVSDQIRFRTHGWEKFARGITFLAMGMIKKVLLADPCGKVADECFGAGALAAGDAWLGAIGYAFQIYFDFSAYSDMAIGLGLMFGFVFAKNFDSPYKSRSITEFWQRWHLSLSHWLRDYLYIPLGGNRLGSGRTYVNLMLVMLLGGLWHGASWNFVIWGGIHGLVLAGERMLGKQSPYHRLPGPLRVGVTFLIVTVAWVFFRAPTLEGALDYCGAMFGLDGEGNADLVGGQIHTAYHLATILAAGLVAFVGVQSWDFTRRLTWPRLAGIGIGFAVALVVLSATSFHPFIYFIF